MSTADHHHHHHHHNHPPAFAATTIGSSMATAPGIKFKSQPLHNFSLPHLRWAHKNHHFPHSSATASTSHHHPDPADSPEPVPQGSDERVVTNSAQPAVKQPLSSARASRKPFPSASSPRSSGHQNQKAEKDDVGGEDGGGEENNEVKPWNLRPRKVANLPPPTTSRVEILQDSKTVPSQKNGNDGGPSTYGLNRPTRLRGTACQVGVVGPGGHGSERHRKVAEEKRKLWISLSKEEIEEDVYALTGSRPRKPKKRPRNVQKQLDNIFPALYLVGMSSESYRVHDTAR